MWGIMTIIYKNYASPRALMAGDPRNTAQSFWIQFKDMTGDTPLMAKIRDWVANKARR